MIGEGYLLIQDYAVLMLGEGTFDILDIEPIEMLGVGEMYVGSTANYINAELPAMDCVFRETNNNTGDIYATLPEMTADLVGGLYVPPAIQYLYAVLPPLTASIFVETSSAVNIDATLPEFICKVADHEYGEIDTTLPEMVSFLQEDPTPDTAQIVSIVYALDGMMGLVEYLVIIDANGQITTTLTGTKEYIAELLSTLSASATCSGIGTFSMSVVSSASATADLSGVVAVPVTSDPTVTTSPTGTVGETVTVTTGPDGETITTTVVVTLDEGVYTTTTTVVTTYLLPALDPDSRVWVVNMDTGQSNQYDDYGFLSFFERDGEYFGVAEDGVYQLTGDLDAGRPISTYVDFGKSDCGVSGTKKVPNVHVGTSNGTDMYLRVTTDSGTATYQLERCYRGPTGWRATVPQTDMQGWEWRWELIANNAFELHGIEFVPVKLNKRM